MKKYSIQIMKIGDIDHLDMSSDLLNFFQNSGIITYKDQVLEEHIYNINDMVDEIEGGTCEISEALAEEFNELVSALHKKDVGYLRIIYS